MYKKGKKLDEAGMYSEATEYYLDALARKRTNVDAKIALKNSGQKVLDDHLMEFYQAQAIDDHKRAVYSYLSALEFKDRVSYVGVNLDMPSNYEDMFKQSKMSYVSGLYGEANEYLEVEDYEKATAKFEEIKKLVPDFKNVKELSKTAFQEPLYQKALGLYDNSEYRDAFYLFQKVNSQGEYKDSKSLEAICLENGLFTVGIVAFKNSGKVSGADEALAAAIAREALNSGNPFLRILDRSQTKEILDEQYLSMSGNVELSKANLAGELLGAEALLTGEVIRADLQNGGIDRAARRGFKARPVQVKDPKTGKKRTKYYYDRVQYYEVKKQNQAVISFQYRLVSTSTGEVLAADVVTIEKSDETEYIEYNGDVKYLYPGTWGKSTAQDKVDRSYTRKNSITRLSKAKTEVRSSDALATDAYNDIGRRVSSELVSKIK